MRRNSFYDRKKSVRLAAALAVILAANVCTPAFAAQDAVVVSATDGAETVNALEEMRTGAASPMDGTEILGRRAKLSATSLSLYLAQRNTKAETICYFNAAGDYGIREESLYPTNESKIPYAPLISLENTVYNGLPAIRITASDTGGMQKGSYTYKLIPYDKESGEELKTVTLKISVKSETTYPSIKLNTSSVTLNSQIAGDYAYIYPVTEGVKIQPLDSPENPAKIGSGLDVKLMNESTARISIKKKNAKGSALKATLCFYYGPDWNYKVVKKTITVKTSTKTPKVTLKAKSGGKLDLLQRDAYCMEYTPVVSYTGFVLKDIRISDADQRDFDRQFILLTERDANGDVRSVKIRLREDATVFPHTRGYSFSYVLHGNGSDAKEITGALSLNLKTVQGNVGIKAMSTAKLKLSKTVSDNQTGYVHYQVNTPVFASVSGDSVEENFNALKIPKGAFSTEIKTDACGHLMTIGVKADPSKVEAGKKYTLDYKVYPKGGAGHKYTKLKITVTITE